MKFLIPTEPEDTHAILVKHALETMGHEVTLTFAANKPTSRKIPPHSEVDGYKWQNTDHYNAPYEVVWWRQVRRPDLPNNVTRLENYQFVISENKLGYESITPKVAPNAWWVNSIEAGNRANFKLLQLTLASECGMTIPTTLCSQDRQEIQQFLNTHQNHGVVYKPLYSNIKLKSKRIHRNITSINLLNSPSLQQTPGIYQKQIKAQLTLRITCFGHYMVAAKLTSVAHPNGLADWRVVYRGKKIVEAYSLPIEIEAKIRLFMHRLGIVFGVFDFIVTEEDDYVFLDVDEQGEFLWIEEYNPEFKMLDMFVHFLVNKSKDFTWCSKPFNHTIDHYNKTLQKISISSIKRI